MLISEFQVDLAIQELTIATQVYPEETQLLDLLGQAYLESGDASKALEAFATSVKKAPDSHFMKWMYLGQLQEGLDSINCFQKGVEIMSRMREQCAKLGDQKEAVELGRQMSTAMCSMAEIYVTDCCDEPNAESETERLLKAAAEADPENPEAYQALGNLRLVQGRKEEAGVCLGKCLKLMEDEAVLENMSYAFKGLVAKMCVELQHWSEGSDLLETMLQEDDCFAETWYLAGSCYYHLKDYTSSVTYLNRALELLARAPDAELEEGVKKLLSLATPLAGGSMDDEGGPAADEEESGDDDDEKSMEA